MGLFDAIASTVGNLTDNVLGMANQNHQNKVNLRMMREQNAFNAEQSKLQRDWQEKMWDMNNAYNSPEAMISRGLNPFIQGSAAMAGSKAPASGGSAATAAPVPSMQAFHPDFSSVGAALASFAQAKKLMSESSQINVMTPYMIDKMRGDTNYKQIGIGESGYWNKQTGRISAELDQSMERQNLENAVTASKLSAAQTTQIYLQSDAQAVLNKYMDAQQQADLFTKAQYLYNLVQQGALTKQQVVTEMKRAIMISAQTLGYKINNSIALRTSDALISATNMAYYTQYYDSLWDYKNVGIRKGVEYSKNKAIRDYYKWRAENARKDFNSYGLRNAIDYGTEFIQNIPSPRPRPSFRRNPFSANGIGY
nr:MAG TPA: Putative minor capsid protein [Microviridae sp.]